MGSEQHRERRKRWTGCSGVLFCFRPQKGGKRIVPASRIPEANASTSHQNGPQAEGLANQVAGHVTSFQAPPPSPVSFANSAAPSTIQSPNNYLSLAANSPGGPSSAMYAKGPYADETQLVSPPVFFSNYTTEPSTAPLTPPPESAHLTTPSSPDVPYARFLASSRDPKSPGKTKYRGSNDLQAAYSLYPGSPASSLRSPVSREATDYNVSPHPERDSEFAHLWDPTQNGKYTRNASGPLYGANNTGVSHDSNFFCPATFAQFYVDQTDQEYCGGRISVSREPDSYSGAINGHHNRLNMNNKQEPEEEEAYRASFGFSADEMITTSQYVEISDVSFSTPFTTNKSDWIDPSKHIKDKDAQLSLPHLLNLKHVRTEHDPELLQYSCNDFQDLKAQRKNSDLFASVTRGIHTSQEVEQEDIFSQMGAPRHNRKYHLGSCSDAEIEYSRGRSLRERKGGLLME